MKRIILLSAFGSTALFAQQFEDVSALDALVAATVEGARPIDQRLKLAHCPEGAAIDPPALGAVAVRCKSLGWRIRVPLILASTTSNAPEIIIRRGDPIELVSGGAGFEVSRQTVAMEDGSIGKSIRVKSLTEASVYIGKVTAAGSVQISR
ncbi:MAG: flagella basal body P-ring formation protein FlgA [Pseudomonadota bacterium]